MRLRRWTLRAHPMDRSSFSQALAAVWDSEKDQFFTRRGAAKAGQFYSFGIGIPIHFEPVRIDGKEAS